VAYVNSGKNADLVSAAANNTQRKNAQREDLILDRQQENCASRQIRKNFVSLPATALRILGTLLGMVPGSAFRAGGQIVPDADARTHAVYEVVMNTGSGRNLLREDYDISKAARHVTA
jgi:hypothetical protein